MTEEILVKREDKILHLTFNRPERKNAINLAMYSVLATEIRQSSDDGTRAIVLTGEGECFTSGNDLADFANATNIQDADNPIAQFIYALSQCPIPVVVGVTGVAVGIGTTLLFHSDLVYADSSAQFRLPFVNLGLCPEFASSYVLPRLAGHAKAAEWLMLGEFFSADNALSAGVINEIVETPKQKALEQAQKLATQPPTALRTAKALIKKSSAKPIANTIQDEFEAFAQGLQGPEFAEAVGAFFEKREADFSKF